DGAQRGVAGAASILAKLVLGGRLQEDEIVFEDVLDAEKDVTKPRLAHQRGQRLSVHGNGRSHGLHRVRDVVQAGVDDGAAQCLKAADVERDVVVNDKDGARAVVASIANIGQHAIE